MLACHAGITTGMESTVLSVAKLSDTKWLYKFSRNIVGQVVVQPTAYGGSGNISISHCEVMNASAPDQCGVLAHLPSIE